MSAKPAKPGCSFVNIRHESAVGPGQFRIVEELFGWRDVQGAVKTFASEDFEEIIWFRVNSREYGIAFVDKKSGKRVEFVGFRENDYEVLNTYLKKHWQGTIENEKLATKGWHWGTYKVTNDRYCFEINDQRSFEVPFSKLANVATSKCDITLELKNEEVRSEDHIVEIRFVVPQPKEGDAVEIAENIRSEIQDASGLSAGSSDAILSLHYKQCQMPHGRFEIQIYPTWVKLHGKSSNFSIPFDNIVNMFMLPSPQGSWSCLVLQLATPLRRGQTKYNSVIVQLDDKKELECDLNLPSERIQEMQQIVPELKQHMSIVEYELGGYLMRALTGKPLIGPSGFRGASEYPCFRCSQKITPGLFYPLDTMFIFIPKPVVIVRFDEIASVDFGRIQGSQTRLFDFQLTLKNGIEQEFTSVDRQDLQPFMDFLNSKNLRVRNLTTISKEDRADMDEDDEGPEDLMGDEESSDQDFEEGDEDESAEEESESDDASDDDEE